METNMDEGISGDTQIKILAHWDDGKSSAIEWIGGATRGSFSQIDKLIDDTLKEVKEQGFEIVSEFKPEVDDVHYVQYTAKANKGEQKGLIDVLIYLDEEDMFASSVKEKLPKFESIQDVKARIKALHEQFEMFQQPVMGEADDEEDADSEMIDYENKLTDDVLEKFAEGLLTKLGELEMLGQVPPIESPVQAKKALLAVIRSLNLRKGVLNKMGRKFARLGAKQFLRRQRRELSHSLTK